MDETAELRMVADEAAIRRLINRYFFAIDRCDGEALASIYTPEGVERGDGVVVDIATHVERFMQTATRFPYRHHIMGSVDIAITGDTATGDLYALAFLVVDAADDVRGDGRVVVRGLQYLDDYVRTGEGWRIRRRNGPIGLWQYELDSVPPELPGFAYEGRRD